MCSHLSALGILRANNVLYIALKYDGIRNIASCAIGIIHPFNRFTEGSVEEVAL